MHPQVREYVIRHAVPFCPRSVLEIGSRNVNGSVRDLFPGCEYVGIDRIAGRDVDVVAEARDYDGGARFDLALSLEAMEHCETPIDIVECAARSLRGGGRLVLTCATDPRAPHTVEGRAMAGCGGEFYRNVDAGELRYMLSGEHWCDVEIEREGGDLRAVATRC